jgi:hypothetical protein
MGIRETTELPSISVTWNKTGVLWAWDEQMQCYVELTAETPGNVPVETPPGETPPAAPAEPEEDE